MAVRIRKNGRIFCAAISSKEDGDTYINDGLHYELSVIGKILVTESFEKHSKNGEWWWKWKAPKGVIIDDFYLFP